MFSLTYVSSAVTPFTPKQLRDLLAVCRENNRRREITGMLLYKDGNFMQALEGIESKVRESHQIIAADPRHHGLITLLQGSVPEREFSDWTMGFRDLGVDIDNPEGYSEFLNLPLTAKDFQANPTKAHKLLLMFKKTMRADLG